jgi:hypothetical protein
MELSKIWTSIPPIFFSDEESIAVQYTEASFQWKVLMVAAGHTVVLSTDGTNPPDATDQWTSAAVLTWGDTADPRAWIVLRSPTNSPGTNQPVYTLLGLNAPAADTTPTIITLRMSTLPFTGGSETAYPTAPNEQTHPMTTWISWSTPRRSLCMGWRTADGDVLYGLKPAGVPFFTSFFIYRGSGGFNDSGYGAYRAVWGLIFTSVDNDAMTWVAVSSGNSWRGCVSNGTITNAAGVFPTSPLQTLTFNQGRLEDGSVPRALAYIFNNTSATPRYYGIWLDVYGAPGEAPFAELEADDLDPYRLICIGCLWVPIAAAQVASNPRIP